jgi:hypothetical protein
MVKELECLQTGMFHSKDTCPVEASTSVRLLILSGVPIHIKKEIALKSSVAHIPPLVHRWLPKLVLKTISKEANRCIGLANTP